jgi:hypothetical protein
MAEAEGMRKLDALLATDVAGYFRLMLQDAEPRPFWRTVPHECKTSILLGIDDTL